MIVPDPTPIRTAAPSKPVTRQTCSYDASDIRTPFVYWGGAVADDRSLPLDAAGLTERTFFRYFADKREVLFRGYGERQQLIVDAVDVAPYRQRRSRRSPSASDREQLGSFVVAS